MSYIEDLAAQRDRFEHVSDDVLLDIVTGEGTCTWLYTNNLEPDSRWACLELELRTHGGQSLGVWGALPAEDVRALYPVWLARRQGGEW